MAGMRKLADFQNTLGIHSSLHKSSVDVDVRVRSFEPILFKRYICDSALERGVKGLTFLMTSICIHSKCSIECSLNLATRSIVLPYEQDWAITEED
jgi:hypothetical protein